MPGISPGTIIYYTSLHALNFNSHQFPLHQTHPPPSRPPRFYVPSSLSGNTLLRLPTTESHHATRTLRLKEGDQLEICDGRGATAFAEIASIDKNGALIRLTSQPSIAHLETFQWTLAVACGSLKGGRADWLVEKAAEIGCSTFQPLLTTRSPSITGSDTTSDSDQKKQKKKKKGQSEEEDDEDYFAAGGGRFGRWHRVAAAAMKQCLRPRAMKIEAPCTVGQLCDLIRENKEIVWVGTEGAPPIHQISTSAAENFRNSEETSHGVLIIGPEGDFTAEELKQLAEAGAQSVGLGPLRLRTETAAISILSYARFAFETNR